MYHFEPKEIEARMDLPTVRIILDMGYSRDNVKAVIETRLSTTGTGRKFVFFYIRGKGRSIF